MSEKRPGLTPGQKDNAAEIIHYYNVDEPDKNEENMPALPLAEDLKAQAESQDNNPQ